MPKSMTGFGRERRVFSSKEIIVDIKSVNSRFYEFSVKCPRAYGFVESRLKNLLAGRISRGKVEVCVTVLNQTGAEAEIEVNEELAVQYVDALRAAKDKLRLPDDLSLSCLLRLQDVFTVKKTVEDDDVVWQQISETAELALDRFVQSRETEGARLREDILSRLEAVENAVSVIEEKSPQTNRAYFERLYEKIKEVVADRCIDEARVLTEAAIFSDKSAVDEETVRLRSHIAQYREILEKDCAVGKELDFLTQEMNREVNTIGSKCQDLEITKLVVFLKNEVEKIREQVQNIE